MGAGTVVDPLASREGEHTEFKKQYVR
jgi:hypothetical protein